jgi:dnd system-associated protein 4
MRGIKRTKEFETLVRQLAEINHSDVGRPIFPTMRELMCFAAMLGFEKNRNKLLGQPTMEIDGRTFENHQQSLDLIYLIALADAKDAEILREENEDKALDIFERYAQGGFEIISGWLAAKPEDENGDEAILTALAKEGYLELARDVDSANADISFS